MFSHDLFAIVSSYWMGEGQAGQWTPFSHLLCISESSVLSAFTFETITIFTTHKQWQQQDIQATSLEIQFRDEVWPSTDLSFGPSSDIFLSHCNKVQLILVSFPLKVAGLLTISKKPGLHYILIGRLSVLKHRKDFYSNTVNSLLTLKRSRM